jgi:glycosyltransferase involved in cell wall biosynthesis
MKPLVSIIIPTYNRARDIERALKSVLAQTYPNWEALIVDNYSSDNTDDVVKGFNDTRMRLFKIHNDGVVAASRNEGIKHAIGEYIAFLDSDDWWLPRKLEVSLQYLKQGADVVYHDLFVATKARQRLFLKIERTRDLRHPAFDDLIVNGNGLLNSGVVVRKDLLHAINGLSEDRNLIAAEDYDAWLRIAKFGGTFRRIPKTLGYYWKGGGNLSNPDRLFENLGAIEERYADAILEVGAHHSIYWIAYVKGRAHYLLASYGAARRNLEFIRWRDAPLSIFIKSRWMLLLINLAGH